MRDHDQQGPDELTAGEAAFAARIGAVLRTDAAPPEDFDSRLMAHLRDGDDLTTRTPTPTPTRTPLRLEQGRPWWTRKRPLALSPLGGLALAAGFAGLVALGTLGAVRATGPLRTELAAARVDTVHLVRFIIQQPGAQRVALVGDFNGWSHEAMPLESSTDGATWSVSVPLAPGRYEYAFVVDGQRWIADPSTKAVRDEFGGETSVLRLASAGDRAM